MSARGFDMIVHPGEMLEDKENTSGQRPGNGAGAAASSFKLTAHGLQRLPAAPRRAGAATSALVVSLAATP